MESNAFSTLARLKIMVIPVGSISKAAYEEWNALLRAFESIPLVDVPPVRNDDRTRFMPPAASNGHLHLDFVSHPPPIWHHSLALFRPSLFPLGVIGIASCSASTSLHALQAEFHKKVKHMYPYNSPYPLAQSCFAFEDSVEHTQLNAEDNGLEIIPSVLGAKISNHLGMLLAGFCSQILAGFASLTRSLDSPKGWEILHSALFPTYPLETDDEQPQLKLRTDSPRSSSESARMSVQPTITGSPPRTFPTLTRSSSSASTTNRNSTIAKNRRSMLQSNSPPNARLSKVVADLFLLAGRLSDAVNWYNDAVTHLRSTPDPVWHAAVLEGLCTASVLESWAGSAGLQTSISANTLRDPWSEISDRMNMAIHMYFKAPLADGSKDYPTVTLLYCSCVLRFTQFLFSIWSCNGWGPVAFLTMLSSSLPPSFTPEPPSNARRWRMTSMTTISRTQIANIVAQAHGPWVMHLHSHDKIHLLSYMAGIYSCLGFGRKEVYVLRELVSVVMDLVVLAREERREQNMARMGVADGNLSELAASVHVTVREHQLKDGNRSILRLLIYICGIYGVNLKAVPLQEQNSTKENDPEWEERLNSIDFSRQPTYGWSELQMGVVREAIAVTEALPELASLSQFSLSSLRALYSHLTAPEQYSLYNAAKNAIQVSQRRGEDFKLEYWSGRPVVSVEVVPLPFSRIPLEHSKSELGLRESLQSPTSGARDPFIYNPRLRSSAASQTLLIQSEQLEFILTLQNPFLFDLELSNVQLSTSGVPFQSQPVTVTIPANSFCPVTLVGIAELPGLLTIRGCFAQTAGCETREFLLPLSTDEEESKMEKRRTMKEAELDRFKFTGLDARPSHREKKRLSFAVTTGAQPTTTSNEPAPTKFVECRVVPEQPLLRIRRTSLTHGAVMMYDGESTTIRLTVENVSVLPIDFLKLTFDDSTIAPMQRLLNEGEMSVAETYETEYDLRRRPVFQWKSRDEPKGVKPGQKAVLTISCLGKIGCVSGTVQIAYAHIGTDTTDSFYTRQILYPVLVTVNQTLECSSMDILPFSPIPTLPLDEQEFDADEKTRRNLLEVDSESDWCLFTVDVRNSYALPFEVHFERQQEGTEAVSCSRLVPPGSTSRITLPLRRIFLPVEQISRPIPSLSDRQFVVSKAPVGNMNQSVQQELFWYREELFNSITARWKEPGGSRNGDLSLRKQRLTAPMMENLKTDPVRVNVTLLQQIEDGEDSREEKPIPPINGKVYAQPTQFHIIRCSVFNATAESKILVLSIAANPLEYFHVEGTLMDIPIGRVESKASKEVEIPVCFVAEGQFEFVAEVRILGDQARSGEGELKVIVREL
ncbi:hypothetical protein FRC18_010798 [Serendipita sp. 400]|nr:hypothetical protein FRC18_010798 [Serendipita sp. 400]